MKNFLKFAGCLSALSFFVVEGMHKSPKSFDHSVESSVMSPIMAPVTIYGRFVMIPVTDVTALHLISSDGIMSFLAPKGAKMSTIKSILGSNGFSETHPDPISLQSSRRQLEGETMVSVPKEVPEGSSSAIAFLTGHKTKIPEDELSLFFLRSLLLLDKADKSLIGQIDDKLSYFESYYKVDPYYESLKRVHETGIHEYAKLFTEAGLEDIQLILEFSALSRIHNPECSRDFEMVLNSLKMITEIVKESEINSALLQKFKSLYERITSE